MKSKSIVDEIKARIRKMSADDREDLAAQLRYKAKSILAGQYDPEDYAGDNNLWAGDLLRAAGLIERLRLTKEELKSCAISDCCRFEALNQGEAEEIEAILE